jgi:hypothetical protein
MVVPAVKLLSATALACLSLYALTLMFQPKLSSPLTLKSVAFESDAGRACRHPPLPPLPPAPCPEYAPPPCAVDMGAVSTSLLFGLATGAAGMWYVLKAK